MSINARELVVEATTRLFIDKDPTAVDRYFGPTYIQHSQLAGDGVAGLKTLADSLPADFAYEPVRVLAEGDLVVCHGLYRGFGPDPLVAFDVFRVEEGRIVEHWDALTPVVTTTASGRSQTDGPTQVTYPGERAASRALLEGFTAQVLVGKDYSVLTDYISLDQYDQHNPEAADGLAGFGAAAAAWGEAGKSLDYQTVHQIIAEGEFVFTRSEGSFGVPVSYNDLWRVDGGRIVEHWDIIDPIRANPPHDNGVF